MSGLIASWDFGGARHRLVEVAEDNYTLERCDRATPGCELWTTVCETKGIRLRDGGAHLYNLKALIAGIEELAGRIKDAGVSMTYRKG